jgi:molybdopterin/thiamine biosynthesis adenylyltransferase
MTTLGKWLVVVGCGGNIGSFLGPLVARLLGVGRITLIDGDVYEAKNLRSQDIRRSDVGKAKAQVQARRLRRIDTHVAVKAFTARVEDVPLGALRGEIILAGVDTRLARRTINTIAWRLGVPWIDAGVSADGLLARVNVYVPGPEQPCVECAWDDADYAALEVAYPCAGEAPPAPTNAPAALGALAASLQALECEKALAGQWDQVLVGRQVTVSAAAHRHVVTTFRPNPRCRFAHATWTIETVERTPDQLTLAEAFALGGGAADAERAHGVRVEGQVFVRKLTCSSCGATRELPLHLVGRLPRKDRTCMCGQAMRATGFDTTEWLRGDALAAAECSRTLASLGVAVGDVMSVERSGETTHHQIGQLGGPR